jgi:glyoxylate reductase
MSESILVTTRLPAGALQILRDAGDVRVAEAPLDGEALREQARGRSAIVSLLTDRIDAAVMDAAGPPLRIVANIAMGFDNIDTDAARARGVVVTNTPGVLTEAVAQLTWALLLAATRRVAEGDRLVRRGAWAGWALDLLPGMELTGKLLGIVGAGRIGRAVAAKAQAFGMRVVFATRSAKDQVDGHPVISFDELLVSSDVVSLHLPLTPETRYLINRRTLARMRRSAFLINTSRGALIDEDALIWALEERLIAGAALDVYAHEPDVPAGLVALEHVVLAPHIGSATRETRAAMAELAARNVAAVLRGQPPLTPI